MSWKKRIAKDILELQNANFVIRSDDNSETLTDLTRFQVLLQGPKDTPYENGKWFVRFTIPQSFPFSSPSVGFVQHIMHPNIDFSSGTICLDTLNTKWSACMTIRHIVEDVLPYLLTYPNPDDPLNREAASLLKGNPAEYSRQVIQMVQKHSYKE